MCLIAAAALLLTNDCCLLVDAIGVRVGGGVFAADDQLPDCCCGVIAL